LHLHASLSISYVVMYCIRVVAALVNKNGKYEEGGSGRLETIIQPLLLYIHITDYNLLRLMLLGLCLYDDP
jgi:hypothetical protein